MNNINHEYDTYFSHIYAEDAVWDYPLAQTIREKLPESRIIPIKHYKDVFCKKGQSFVSQKNSPKMILAVKDDSWYYPGSPMCDNYGNDNVYYTAEMMNCLYNCEYCYLRGMYNSANIVIFVNLDDCFAAVEKILPAFLYVSYESDLLALEFLTGFTRRWLGFCAEHTDAQIEVRTKSAAFKQIIDIPPLPNVTLAWTISPDSVVEKFEKGSPLLESRLINVREAMEKGWKVRICVDPVIKFSGWREAYREMAAVICATIDVKKLAGLSIGTFRAPADYYKKMRKLTPYSEIFAYQVVAGDSGMCYPNAQEVIEYASSCITSK